jgi:hypothetical protein
MNSLRNTIILSSIAILAIVGGIVFYVGKAGSISADVESKDCKFYAFTDRKSYFPNQLVTIGIKNDKYSKCTLKIRNDIGPWTVVDANNKQIYKADSADKTIVNLKPGEKEDWQWSMKDSSGSPIKPGKYKIKMTSLNKTIDFTVTSN